MDEIDKKILGYIIRDGPLSASNLVKLVFDPVNRVDRQRCYVKLRYRLDKMVAGSMLDLDDRTRQFSLHDCIISDESTLVLHTSTGDVAVDTGPTICFIRPDEYNDIIFLNQ